MRAMATKTSILGDVNLMQQMATGRINNLMQFTIRREHFRDLSDYSTELFMPFGGLLIQPAQSVLHEIYDPPSDKVYEKADISLDYYADQIEEVVIPPVGEFKVLLARSPCLTRR